MKEDQMDGSCNVPGEYEKFFQNTNRKTCREETTLEDKNESMTHPFQNSIQMSYQLHVSAALSPVKNSKVSTGRVSEPV
jgi:hypothetical protein